MYETIDTQTDDLLNREKNTKIICSELNNFIELKPTLQTVISHIEELSHCEAVSIRLHDGDGDYPYYVYLGFPKKFIKLENSLCSKDRSGKRIPLNENEYHLDCMCGNVLQGRFDPSLSMFTENGSFWSNHTSAMLAASTQEDLQGKTRNYCNSCGYESVSLIPIKSKDNILGLIQINDKREGMFTKNLIAHLEMIGEQIGVAVENSSIHSNLKDKYHENHEINNLLTSEIEERKQIEKTLMEAQAIIENNEKKARTIINASTDSIILLNSRHIVEDVNQKFLKTVHKSRNEIIGSSIRDYLPLKLITQWREQINKVSKSKEPAYFEITYAEELFDIMIHPILDKFKHIEQFAIFMNNITDYKRMQDQLIRSEKLVATGKLAAFIAHEINSPLQGIVSLLEVVKTSDNLDDNERKCMNLVGKGFLQIEETVAQLLNLNRPEKSKIQSVDINTLIKDTVALLKAYLNQNSVEINLSLSSKISAIKASPQQLTQVFFNLINNAVEAMTIEHYQNNSDDKLSKSKNQISIRTIKKKTNIVITVSDTGTGIAKKDLEHLFDPFYTSKKQMGLGVGLSISSGHIAEHNGTITAKNSPGGGAVFTIVLPLKKQQGSKS